MKSKKIISLVLVLVIALSCALTLASCDTKTTNLPIVCGENSMNDKTGVATYGVDYYNLGTKAGDMAADILLNGKDPADIKVATDPNPALTINETVAGDIGFTIPDSVKDKATGAKATKLTRTDAVVESGEDFTVGILQLLPHEALDLANEGFVDQLSIKMKEAGKKVKILDQDAANDLANANTIATTFVSQDVDLIYAIATPAAQSAKEATKESKTPVLFNAVTNPVDAGLVTSMDAPGGNVTGVSDMNPVEKQIDLIAELLGKTDIKIGFLYTSSEPNSVFQIDIAKAYCDTKGYTYEIGSIADINDLENTMIKLQSSGIDAIYIPTDNTIANAATQVHSLNKGE